MSKYHPLWQYIAAQHTTPIKLSFSEINQIVGEELDHSFLTFQKELSAYGWRVGKISMKAQTILFEKPSGTV